MILRLLLAVALGLLAGAVLRSMSRGGRPLTSRPPGSAGAPQLGRRMVKDRVCDTYIPMDGAIEHVGPSGERSYFCSEACRQRFEAARR